MKKSTYHSALITGWVVLVGIVYYSIFERNNIEGLDKKNLESKIVKLEENNTRYLGEKDSNIIFNYVVYHFYNPPKKIIIPKKEDNFKEYIITIDNDGNMGFSYNKFFNGRRINNIDSLLFKAEEDTSKILIGKFNEN